MNHDDQALELIKEFLGDEQSDYDAHDTDLLDMDWDGEDMFAA